MTPVIREHNCTVISNKAVNKQYRLLVLQVPALALRAEPGQFFNLLCPQYNDLTPFFRRPMSVYRLERRQNQLHFLYKVVGVGTTALSRLESGAAFNIFGPLGRGFWLKAEWQSLLLVARGVGLATLAPLAQLAKQEGRRLFAICSARSPQDLLSVDYFKEQGAAVYSVTDSDGSSDTVRVEKLICSLVEQQRIDAFFTCGSNRLLKLLQKLGQRYNLPGQVALEQQMACGLGMCYSCVRPFIKNGQQVDLRVCREGPVFDLQEAVAW